jgi:3-methyladenine DNA glycosylase AlkD
MPFDPLQYRSAWLAAAAAQADARLAVGMSDYMRRQFAFLGIPAPARRELAKAFFAAEGLPPAEALPELLRAFWELPYREAHYFAMELPLRLKKQWQEGWLAPLEACVLSQSWWDTVDYLAAHPVGFHFQRFPETRPAQVMAWADGPHLWLNRTAILCQLRCGEHTDWDLLQRAMLPHLRSSEFFLQKAIGWALRQYARSRPDRVRAFAAAHPLAPLSRREALKHLSA